jgi:hypothetical protein
MGTDRREKRGFLDRMNRIYRIRGGGGRFEQ